MQTEEAFLEKNIFHGLKNINTGFDVPSIKYFSEADFEIILQRVKEFGLGISGIEPWKDGEYFGCEVFELTDMKADDPKWYWTAFKNFKNKDRQLQYSASYIIPPKYLK